MSKKGPYTKMPLISAEISGQVLGYLDSNQEQKNQNLPCCQLHHTPMAQTEAQTTVYFSARSDAHRRSGSCSQRPIGEPTGSTVSDALQWKHVFLIRREATQRPEDEGDRAPGDAA